jgi:hypothetical protein
MALHGVWSGKALRSFLSSSLFRSSLCEDWREEISRKESKSERRIDKPWISALKGRIRSDH